MLLRYEADMDKLFWNAAKIKSPGWTNNKLKQTL